MKYWGGVNPLTASCRRVHGLLQFSDANCGEWAELLQNVFSAQGMSVVQRFRLDTPEPAFPASLVPVGSTTTPQQHAFQQILQFLPPTSVILLPPNAPAPIQRLIVPKWNVPVQNTPVCYLSDRANRNFADANMTLPLTNGNQLEYFELDGSRAQGNDNPISEFENHAIVKYDGKFYDPSYGFGPFSSEQDYETKALYGRSVRVYVGTIASTPDGPMPEVRGVLYHLNHEDPSSSDLIFTPID